MGFWNFDIIKTLKFGAKSLTRIFTAPFLMKTRNISKVANPNSIVTQVMTDVRKGLSDFRKVKPESIKDYVATPRYYVAKKLVVIILILVLLLPLVYIQFLHPIVKSKFLTNTMYINSQEMYGYTGKVKLLSKGNGGVLFKGRMENGRITGPGELYDYKGKLVYKGDFLMEMYEGNGETFFANGKTQYKGQFSKNLYNGTGSLYYSNGQLKFTGSFVNGNPSGYGTIYSAKGKTVYTGDLKDGKFDGTGTVYQNGQVLYQGELSAGMMKGNGKIYSGKKVIYDGEFNNNKLEGKGKSYDPVKGKLIYDGEFKDGRYSGKGKLFDIKTGKLVYEGDFYNGYYDGEGKLYDPKTEFPVYEGNFRTGRYDGQGKEYGKNNGSLIYEGEFLLGNYNGKGVMYDEGTGMTLLEGVFRNGALAYSESKDSQPADNPEVVPGNTNSGKTQDNSAQDTTNKDSKDTNGGTDAASGSKDTAGKDGAGSKNIYKGPLTETKEIDYSALAAMTVEDAGKVLDTTPEEWTVDEGSAKVYEDTTENIGMTIQSDSHGKMIGIDIWNNSKVKGVAPGMTKDQITAVLGKPASETAEAMGENRMVSVSQSNRFAGRLTNLSAESKITVVKYKTEKGYINAIFAKSDDKALIIEVR